MRPAASGEAPPRRVTAALSEQLWDRLGNIPTPREVEAVGAHSASHFSAGRRHLGLSFTSSRTRAGLP